MVGSRNKRGWFSIDCRTCGESLMAVPEATVPTARNSHDGLAWVHHDGYDSETLMIIQQDRGHVPIYRRTQIRWPAQVRWPADASS